MYTFKKSSFKCAFLIFMWQDFFKFLFPFRVLYFLDVKWLMATDKRILFISRYFYATFSLFILLLFSEFISISHCETFSPWKSFQLTQLILALRLLSTPPRPPQIITKQILTMQVVDGIRAFCIYCSSAVGEMMGWTMLLKYYYSYTQQSLL